VNESINISKGKKVVHFCNYGPIDSGMYKTVRELVYEELRMGYDAWVVDNIANNKIRLEGIYHDSLFKEGRVIGLEEDNKSRDADLICWHSWIPPEYIDDRSKHLVMFLHGMPSFIFHNELYHKEPVLSFLKKASHSLTHCHFFITLWPSHKPFWENILRDKLVVTNSWVSSDSINLKSDASFDPGHLKLVVMDTWRAGKEPYYIINSIQILISKYHREEIPYKVTLDIYGQEVKNVQPVWQTLIREGFEKYINFKGKDDPQNIFDRHDILLTQIGDESRIVREGLLSGIPIVSGYPYADWTSFKHDCRDIKGYADQILRCWKLMQDRDKRIKIYRENRNIALRKFDIRKNAIPIFRCYERIFELQKRAYSPSRQSGTAGLASESKNGKIPYSRRSHAACCRELQKSKKRRTDRPTISLCMIVRNEEEYLPGCLESIKSLVDEMVIVDTGSTDKTVEIAKSCGAKVIHHPWNDDFAEARNVALKHATCDWILVLDADEVIAPQDLWKIRELVKNKDVAGYKLVQRTYQEKTTMAEWQAVEYPYPEARGCTGYIPSPLVRLFRRDKDVYFIGMVHELVEYSILEKRGLIVETDIPIHHYGKICRGADRKRKQELYRLIGEKKVEKNPTDSKAYCDLGIQYLELEMYDKAEKVLQKAVELDPENVVALFNLGVSLAAQNENQRAIECYEGVLRYNPEHIGAYNNLATILEKQGRIGEVESLYRQAIAHNPNHYIVHYNLARFMKSKGRYDDAVEEYQKVLSIEPRMVGAHFSLGVLFFKKGDYAKAAESFKRTLELYPLHPESQKNLQVLEQMERSSIKEAPPSKQVKELSGGISAAYSEVANIRRLLAQQNARLGKSVVFFNRGIGFNGDTLLEKPLGGMETALINMARELRKLGYDVKVFCNCDRPGMYHGVEYLELEKINAFNRSSGADYFISVRYLEPFLKEINARFRILWTGDAYDQPYISPLADERLLANIDRIFTVSHWQTRTFIEHFHIPAEKFYITKNGVNKDNFRSLPQDNRKYHRLVYTSTPFRGLDVLLDLFPQIRKRVSEAELYVYSSMAVYQVTREKDEEMFGELYKKAKQPGVYLIGSIPQDRLARELNTAGIMAYPNHFPETSCIAALEAMAAGLPVITTNLGALPETVGRGSILIDGDPHSREYQERFVDETVGLMTNREKWLSLSEAGKEKVFSMNTWDVIAKEWDKELNRLLNAA